MKLKLPATEFILYALALSQTLGYVYTTSVYDGATSTIGISAVLLRNALLGAAVSFGTALAAQKIPRIQAKRARTVGYISLAALLIISPIIIAPAVVVMLPTRVIAWIGNGGAWALAVAIATAPDAVAVAIAAQSGALQSTSEIVAKPSTASAKPAKPNFACSECQRGFKTLNALNAHRRAHKVIQIDASLLRRS